MANLTVKGKGVCESLGLSVGVTVHGVHVMQAEALAQVLQFEGDWEKAWLTIPEELQLVSVKDKPLVTRYSLWQYIHQMRWDERIDVIMDEKVRKPRIARFNEVYSEASTALYPEIDPIKNPWNGMVLNVWVSEKEDYFPALDLKFAEIHYGSAGFQYNGPTLSVQQEFSKAKEVRNPLHPWQLASAKGVLKRATIPTKLGKKLSEVIAL